MLLAQQAQHTNCILLVVSVLPKKHFCSTGCHCSGIGIDLWLAMPQHSHVQHLFYVTPDYVHPCTAHLLLHSQQNHCHQHLPIVTVWDVIVIENCCYTC